MELDLTIGKTTKKPTHYLNFVETYIFATSSIKYEFFTKLELEGVLGKDD